MTIMTVPVSNRKVIASSHLLRYFTGFCEGVSFCDIFSFEMNDLDVCEKECVCSLNFRVRVHILTLTLKV